MLLPDGFVKFNASETTIEVDLRYFSKHNFLGRDVDGYHKNMLILTENAYEQLLKAQKEFVEDGYKLVLYDGYRPQRAVKDFNKWGKDLQDAKMKKIFFPYIDKKDIAPSGYLASSRSPHTRGSTVDVSLISLKKSPHIPSLQNKRLESGREIPFYDDGTVDMGSSFDLFDKVSWYSSKEITPRQYDMRMYLQKKMIKFGFEPYIKEWWHFQLKSEPFPNTYFDFEII